MGDAGADRARWSRTAAYPEIAVGRAAAGAGVFVAHCVRCCGVCWRGEMEREWETYGWCV